MKKIYYLLFALLLCNTNIFSQGNVNLEVRITKLERGSYADCAACGDPDPTWKIQATNNGTGALNYGPVCWHFADMVNTLWDISDYPLMTLNNTNATTFTLGVADAFEKSCSNNNCTYESYNFFTCFPSVYGDSRRCQNPTIVVSNFRQTAPCQWQTAFSSWCGDYRFEYSYRWSFNTAPQLVTQPQSAQLCLGNTTTLTVAAANDPNGWNTGVNYQWQVSTSTACPGTGWVDVLGATSSSYTPTQIPGTRLYRCKVTSNCTADFTSNSTTSNCAVVTYNPMGSPGDLAPDIVSGICGSTVLPGSTHVLGTLSAPNPGAPLGITDFAWAVNGGSPTTFNGSVFTWTAPTNPGTYTINLTYIDNCPQADATANACVVNVGSATCDFAYVSTYGQDSVYRGGPDNPYKTLEYALTQMNGRKYIRMATGVYNEVNPLQLQNDLVIEGGYKVNGNIWTKNNSDSTTIIASGVEVVSTDIAHRVGFVSNGVSNWRLQDLVLLTTNTSSITTGGRGYSNYGVLAINGSSNFEIVRTKIYVGDAAKGQNGSTPSGSGGAGGGGSGGSGGGGSNTRCNGGGSSGTGGSNGNGGALAGGPGGGCGGGGCNVFGCNANGCSGGVGANGSAGAAGAGYAANSRPLTPGVNSPYYTPDGQAASGSNGFGGGGGGGGGGGDIGSCCTCSCGGGGTPNGGNGGNGGGGGLPGSGGFGGGGSFGVYAAGAGTSGSLITSYISSGSFGLGGDGAAGQAGANGAGGAGGNNHGGCDGGIGGNGGTGGAGGSGGRGQDGANGLSQAVVTAGGATITGNSTGVPSTFTVGINYQNAKGCINSEIEMTKSSGVWTLPSGMNFINDLRDYPAGFPISSYNASSSPLLVYVTTPSVEYDLTINGNVYAQYLTIAADNRALPVTTVSSPTICIDGIDSLSATHWGTEVEYDWRIYQATNVNSPLYQSSLPSPVINFYGFTPGLYTIRYRVRESCCGWSKPVFDTIRIMPEPTVYNAFGGGNYCPGSVGALVNLSGSEPGIKYVLYYNGNAVDSVIGSGGPLTFAPQTGVGNYVVVAVRFNGCTSDMFGTVSIGQYPSPQVFTVSGSDTICSSGGILSATINLDGSELGVNYQLVRNGSLPSGPPIPGTGLAMQFTGVTTPGVYTIQASNPITGCKSDMADSAIVVVAPPATSYNVVGGGAFCDGAVGVTVGLSNSDAGVIYQLYQGGVVPAATAITGTGSPISFSAVNVPGFYKVKATSVFGCDGWMNDSVWVSKLSNPIITNVIANNVSCKGNSDGSVQVVAFTQNGLVSYSIDSSATYQSSGSFTSLPSSYYNVYVKDDSGCVTQFAANPVQVTSPLVLTLAMDGTSPDCFGNTTGSATVSVSGGTSPYTYLWNTNPPQTGFSIDQLSGSRTYAVTVTDKNNCIAVDSVYLTDPSAVVVSVVPSNVKCFEGNDGKVVITVNGGLPPYDYYLNGIYQFDSIFTGLTAGNYLATAEDANNCIGSATFSISQPQAFSVNAGPDLISVRGQTVQINGSATSINGIIAYNWSPSTNLSCTACQVTQANPDSTTTYVLMAMDGDSCVGFDSMTVIVKQTVQVFIPTAFTPNNDKLNDYFEMNILGASSIETSVFNRWGERVYFNAAQHNGILNNGDAWDGKKDNKLLPYDTYTYQLKVLFFDGSEETLSGTVTLMK
ncbi:MAG: gliding motility-associated C-terminal domain-containing protein [Chitinophagales bacterium]